MSYLITNIECFYRSTFADEREGAMNGPSIGFARFLDVIERYETSEPREPRRRLHPPIWAARYAAVTDVNEVADKELKFIGLARNVCVSHTVYLFNPSIIHSSKFPSRRFIGSKKQKFLPHFQ